MICSGQRIAGGFAGFFVIDRWRLKDALSYPHPFLKISNE
jgi:hypothetical protein